MTAAFGSGLLMTFSRPFPKVDAVDKVRRI
jgi:hypothetical protein